MKNKNSKIIKTLILSIIILLLTQTVIFAHSGRTDSKGGHKDKKNVSGLGSYHYHCGGHPPHLHKNGVCPYKSSSSTSKSSSNKSSSTSKSSSKKSSSSSKSSTSKSTTNKSSEEKSAETKTESPAKKSAEIVAKSPTTNSATTNESSAIKSPETTAQLPVTNEAEATSKPEIIAVTSVKIENKSKEVLETGKELNLTATVEPANATNKTITWSSSNNNIATIDKAGKVSALAKGTVTITAKSDDGKEDSFSLEIKNPVVEVESGILEGRNVSFKQSSFYRFFNLLVQKVQKTKILFGKFVG